MTKKDYLHFVITRFNIPANYAGRRNATVAEVDPKTNTAYLDNRMALFEKYTFPSFASQTNKDFRWLVLFSDKTPDTYVNRLLELKDKHNWFYPLFLKDKEAYDFDYYLESIISKYDAKNYITTRVDNDDAVSVKLIERIQNYCDEYNVTDAILSFRYGCQYTENGNLLAKQDVLGNHFISLVYRDASKTIISFPHNNIPADIKQLDIGVPSRPMWIEVIHGLNYANQTSFNFKNVVVSRHFLDEFVCNIPWGGRRDVVRNVLKSVGGTGRGIARIVKGKISRGLNGE